MIIARRIRRRLGRFIRYFRILPAIVPLYLKRERYAVCFDLFSIGELQFFGDILTRLTKMQSKVIIYIAHHTDSVDYFNSQMSEVGKKAFHLCYSDLDMIPFRKLDLYITTEQFVSGPPSVYTITVFHGHPSKGVTFTPLAISVNDAMFVFGPLHRQALDFFSACWKLPIPSYLQIFNIGYPKSDKLLNTGNRRDPTVRDLGLDPEKRTILYAPAFNEGASMRECGKQILDILCRMDDYNILAKLPIDCLDRNLVGGIDWYAELGAFERSFPNFRLVRSLEPDTALACSDVLITCISSIAFDFLALKKPVIYVDTPRYFQQILPSLFPGHDVSGWSNETFINAGREFGIVVSTPDELPVAIDEVVNNPAKYPRRKSELPGCLLYNAGRATEAAVTQIEKLLAMKVRSARPFAPLTVHLRDRLAGFIHRIRTTMATESS
jgi:CDP-Glycerol:Poly(glycerophosphate) glycerophosphotransferase